jgi:hypothetical protein
MQEGLEGHLAVTDEDVDSFAANIRTAQGPREALTY